MKDNQRIVQLYKQLYEPLNKSMFDLISFKNNLTKHQALHIIKITKLVDYIDIPRNSWTVSFENQDQWAQLLKYAISAYQFKFTFTELSFKEFSELFKTISIVNFPNLMRILLDEIQIYGLEFVQWLNTPHLKSLNVSDCHITNTNSLQKFVSKDFQQLKLENCPVNNLNILTRVKFNKECHRHKLNLEVDDLKNFKSNEEQHEWNQLNIMFKLQQSHPVEKLNRKFISLNEQIYINTFIRDVQQRENDPPQFIEVLISTFYRMKRQFDRERPDMQTTENESGKQAVQDDETKINQGQQITGFENL